MKMSLALPLLALTAASAPPLPSALPSSQTAPAATPADVPFDQIVFGEASMRMSVPVDIAGAGPYRFIIDTGAQRTVISRELAFRLGLPKGRDVRMTAMTETSVVGTVRIPSISVSTLGGRAIEAPALLARDLGAPGMLGIDSLQDHALAIDFEKQTMAVTPSSKRVVHERSSPDEIVVLAKSMFGQLVVTNATVNGQRVRVILDTGSAVTLGNEALRKRIARRNNAVVPIELTSVTGNKLYVDYGKLNDVRIGDMTIANMPIAFSAAPPFRAFGLENKPALLLGMDALRMFRRVHIDFANRELRLALPKNARQIDRPGTSVSAS